MYERPLIVADQDSHVMANSLFAWNVIEKDCELRGITVQQWCEEYGKRAFMLYERWKHPNPDEPELTSQ